MKTLPIVISGISLITMLLSPIIVKERRVNQSKIEEVSKADITISEDSKWIIESMVSETTFRMNHIHRDVSVIVDINDKSVPDGVGINCMVNGKLFTSPSHDLISSLSFDGISSEIEIQIKGEEIRIFSRAGTLGDLVDMDYDKAVKMQATIEVIDHKLNIEMNGLYNISTGLAINEITCNQQDGISVIHKDTVEVLDNVEFLWMLTENNTPIHLSTRATAISKSPKMNSGIHLDFGKSYSMGGQESVATTMLIDETINSLVLPLN